MTTQASRSEAEIRALVEAQARAVHDKNAEGALAPYAPGLVKFDLAPPLATAGPEALDRGTLEGWFATWDGPIETEVRDLALTIRGDLAFGCGFLRIAGTKIDGERAAVWARLTLCLERLGGNWKIVHEHTSVPFYMDGSYRAAVDLTP